MTFDADKIKVNGPRMDGSFAVTFEVGEYEQEKIAKLLLIPQNTVVRVTIDTEDSYVKPKSEPKES